MTDIATSGPAATVGDHAAAAAAIARLRTQIADLERLMVDIPPHHAGGTRRSAEERLDDLRVALQRAERMQRMQRTGTDKREST
jgi:hypothetical protein